MRAVLAETDHADDDHTEQVGAPVVLQVVGPRLEDERTLALARVVVDSLSEKPHTAFDHATHITAAGGG